MKLRVESASELAIELVAAAPLLPSPPASSGLIEGLAAMISLRRLLLLLALAAGGLGQGWECLHALQALGCALDRAWCVQEGWGGMLAGWRAGLVAGLLAGRGCRTFMHLPQMGSPYLRASSPKGFGL